MRILLISSAFSGLTQRFYTELDDAGFQVSVELHLGDIPQLIEGVSLFQPNLIICPYLTRRLPKEIYEHYRCLIIHPGIIGDRGPSSLDWAIQAGVKEWGVTLMEAHEEMDAGPIWSSRTFPLRTATKSSIFNREVTQAAIECLWEVLSFAQAPDFKPEPLDYSKPEVKGTLLPLMKQTDRAINWNKHSTDEILRRIRAADGSPGLLDEIDGVPVYLFNARKAKGLTGKPGAIIAVANHSICRATVDGAVWIGHLKIKSDTDTQNIKLPATIVLDQIQSNRKRGYSIFSSLITKTVKDISIDYFTPGQKLPCQEVWYEVEGEVAYLYFQFHNGAMSSEQCRLLLKVYQHAATLPVKAIVLIGGEDVWSNGIHLNHIEAAADPAEESWQNINAIDDLIQQIVTTMDKLTIAAVSGNAGAGGAILAIAPDKVLVREGVVFNPHYKKMGGLYGSEYWTYLLPKRVGKEMALELTDGCLPISAKKAWQLGMVDKVLDRQHTIFTAQVKFLANTYIANTVAFRHLLSEKSNKRCIDETLKPLSIYRQGELTQMYANFFGSDEYHKARNKFVLKIKDCTRTPENITKHRHPNVLPLASSGNSSHFVWQDSLELGDETADNDHKSIFMIAEKMVNAPSDGEKAKALSELYHQVKSHFGEEETVMKNTGYPLNPKHAHEHQMMLDSLLKLDINIQNGLWQEGKIEEFMAMLTTHIVDSDMTFNQHWKEMNVFCV